MGEGPRDVGEGPKMVTCSCAMLGGTDLRSERTGHGTKDVTRFHKRGLKSLGPIRVTGKEVRDGHYVRHLTALLRLTITFSSLVVEV